MLQWLYRWLEVAIIREQVRHGSGAAAAVAVFKVIGWEMKVWMEPGPIRSAAETVDGFVVVIIFGILGIKTIGSAILDSYQFFKGRWSASKEGQEKR